MLHISTAGFTFNTVRALQRDQEAWSQNNLSEAWGALFKSEPAKESMQGCSRVSMGEERARAPQEF